VTGRSVAHAAWVALKFLGMFVLGPFLLSLALFLLPVALLRFLLLQILALITIARKKSLRAAGAAFVWTLASPLVIILRLAWALLQYARSAPRHFFDLHVINGRLVFVCEPHYLSAPYMESLGGNRPLPLNCEWCGTAKWQA